MASMRDIKRRRESIQSTSQITKAMKLVSTVKLQKAKTAAEHSKPFNELMYETVCNILACSTNIRHRYLQPSESPKKGILVISSNRGLAGGYNSNVAKLVTESGFDKDDVIIYNMGRKAREILERKGYRISDEDYSDVINEPLYDDAMRICKKMLQDYEDGAIGEIFIAYTSFKNTVVHEPVLKQLLPVSSEKIPSNDDRNKIPMNYEPDEEEALDLIIPKYITSIIYGAIKEAIASENGARMQAMDSATTNAEEMISDLELKFNRARQAAITQEITEIIAGANAIS
ncbi:MAG: ATP synthase F1 subunit gamma [Clostridia bacterium]|nr:ATP synthase F1 subunit gamma [Clostridia bacterium]